MTLEAGGRFCPKCGAYWACDCDLTADLPAAVAFQPSTPGCDHDWSDVVAVEVERDDFPTEARVVVCRLCGIYAVRTRGQQP